jgi:hypothetical protein
MIYLSTFALLLLFQAQSPTQELRLIYDARRNLEQGKTSNIEEAILEREIHPIARRRWGKCTDEVEGEFGVVDVAQGAFTKPQSNQKAFLYRFCHTAHLFAQNGIAVLEDGKIVAHLVYEGGTDSQVGALPDIDGNGLSEILILGFGSTQGETHTGISIIELSQKGGRKFGKTETYFDNCGADEKSKATAYKIYVRAATTPAFYRETFVNNCGLKEPWSRSEAPKRIAIKKDETKYHRLK